MCAMLKIEGVSKQHFGLIAVVVLLVVFQCEYEPPPLFQSLFQNSNLSNISLVCWGLVGLPDWVLHSNLRII